MRGTLAWPESHGDEAKGEQEVRGAGAETGKESEQSKEQGKGELCAEASLSRALSQPDWCGPASAWALAGFW